MCVRLRGNAFWTCVWGTLPTADSWYRKPFPRLCPGYINIDISPEMAAQSTQHCVTASDWSPITSA